MSLAYFNLIDFFQTYFQSYFYNDDFFNFDYAQAKAAVGNFKEAEEVSFYSTFSCGHEQFLGIIFPLKKE